MSDRHPGARHCKTHESYYMDCLTFDALWKRAQGRCEICGASPRKPPMMGLCIDHDRQIGAWAVRGLLCVRCNTHLHREILDQRRVAAYLAAPWWEHILAAAGVPREGIPEPAVGRVVGVSTNLRWRRTERGWERLGSMSGWSGIIDQWADIGARHGPHRVRVI